MGLLHKALGFVLTVYVTISTCEQLVNISSFDNLKLINSSIKKHFGKTSLHTIEPLILTPLIKSGRINDAKQQSKVNLPDFEEIESYSGYFTVNATCNSNMFFWYFPAKFNPEKAPVVLYLQGGPGVSSLVSTVLENGPIHILETGDVIRSNYSWSQYFHLLYIDNPVQVGFSYTDRQECLATDQIQVGREIYLALVQFFSLFRNLQRNNFFITGVSYAGKYVPATAYTIHRKNQNAEIKINLKGIAIENGLIEISNQCKYSQYLYELGLLDEDGKEMFVVLENQLQRAIASEDWELAAYLEIQLLNSDNSLFYNLTGLTHLNYVNDFELMNITDKINKYFNQKEIKQALHVKDMQFELFSPNASIALAHDIAKSVAPTLIELLNNNYKVLLYNGQLDVIVAYSLTRNFVNALQFKGKSDFKTARRLILQVNQEVAGYVREGGNLALAMVRNAGHFAAFDQPKWVLDLMISFTQPECLIVEGNRRITSADCKT